ncbi:tetratricopeptide repeat protein 1-like [Paramacrobiotus metropolitanus]|uniref:tetratricopeptide repeat protein 1-like n=1 Tax=Paramacrobiotus metropolitanus TaxID=2943436 RepID=UPI0024460F82|nr:tetratricopeptide repeat protein 1-like [Paramacrobiotus metropolitanus]
MENSPTEVPPCDTTESTATAEIPHETVEELPYISYAESLELKTQGNRKFGEEDFDGALQDYTVALHISPSETDSSVSKHKSVLLSNRAACYIKLQIKKNYDTAIEDCTKALEHDADNIKALLRRAKLQELTDKLDEALADYKTLAERDPRLPGVMEACMRLPQQIEERNEKMKTEMFGKLKDLGNMFLKPFGLSTENFRMEPQESGGYSVKFEPNKPNPRP